MKIVIEFYKEEKTDSGEVEDVLFDSTEVWVSKEHADSAHSEFYEMIDEIKTRFGDSAQYRG